MEINTTQMTKYFRSAMATYDNQVLNFKKDNFYTHDFCTLKEKLIDIDTYNNLFADSGINLESAKDPKPIPITICARTKKTIFASTKKTQNDIEELTGIFYIPAVLDADCVLHFPKSNPKPPWFPREFLGKMVEPKLLIGISKEVDAFKNNNVDRFFKINSWADYIDYCSNFYHTITQSDFWGGTVINKLPEEPFFELDGKIHLFLDKKPVYTQNIFPLYNDLIRNLESKPLYENFMSTEIRATEKLITDSISEMVNHMGQMGGEYPLSPSQREAVNHFNHMKNGEILAVNGPPGTGKTTLLQSLVANLYVERALAKNYAPVIVAASSNNQAVTNIISSFGNINKVGISNLEKRWLEGVNSFATFLPSGNIMQESGALSYQCTDKYGNNFVAGIEDKNNIKQSQLTMKKNCTEYFQQNVRDLTSCENKLFEELKYFEHSKENLISLAEEASKLNLNGVPIVKHMKTIITQIEEKQIELDNMRTRVNEWNNHYEQLPRLNKFLSFLSPNAKNLESDFRIFLNADELNFLNEHMNINEIKEIYSQRCAAINHSIRELKEEKERIEKIISAYEQELTNLRAHNVDLSASEYNKYNLEQNFINEFLDKKHRYIQFWLAVHYYECRWLNDVKILNSNQNKKDRVDILEKFYRRLCMITPCLVSTLFTLPKHFCATGDNKNYRYMYNYIDLLIIDEAGQVLPEIAAPSFALAKKAVVVGDVHQLEPIWNVNRGLDIALAYENGIIQTKAQFDILEQSGLNTYCSSAMSIASKCCKYQKFSERGLFLCEHRRCYDEIISYCNQLVYDGNLQPLRGAGINDKNLAFNEFPQMGIKQIDSESSYKKANSRQNDVEAEQIADWLKNNYDAIVNAYPNESESNLIGIITPFKAQVTNLKKNIKKILPAHYSKLSIGTVHTFQGAEKRIIIFSSVYGEQDGCYFIDVNTNLMNVAVSRAKDHFFMFGDINCLIGAKNSASGLLREYISDNPVPDFIL